MDKVYEGKIIILTIIIIVLLGCFLVFLFLLFLKQKNIVIKNKEQAELDFKKELLKAQTEIQKETMKYIGREIHDNVGQKLTLSSLYLQQLNYENKAPHIEENINTINTIINESLNDLRHLSKSLTDNTIERNTISELIEDECIKINELKKYTIHFKNRLRLPVDSYQTKSILLRIVQEFLQNSIKHAACENVIIELFDSENELVLLLKDDGKGFDTSVKSKGIGLKNIKKRIEMLRGDFELQSNSKGTRLTIKIPL